MTEKELNQLFFINKECIRLQRDIEEKRSKLGYISPTLSGMPRGTPRDNTDDIAELADLESIMALNLRRLQRERAKLEKFIGGIEDAEIRLIFRLRHIDCMRFREIGIELYMSHETVRKKYKKYIRENVDKIDKAL